MNNVRIGLQSNFPLPLATLNRQIFAPLLYWIMEKKARLKVFFLLICTLNAESVSITSDGNGAEHNQLAYYRVKLKDRKAANQSEIDSRYRKYIPQGCYGQKQLRSLKNGTSRIPYQPQPPDWCSEGSNLVPKKYSDQTEPQKSPSPYKINVYPFQKSETFKGKIFTYSTLHIL